MESIIEALKGTPWWVYVILVVIIKMGLEARKSRVIPLKKIFIFPVLILAWSIFGIFQHFNGVADLFYWIIFVIIGCYLGYRLVKGFLIRADRKKHRIKVPGTNLILIMALIIFATKYFFGYYYATHTYIPESINILRLATTGLISGILVGRVFCYLKKFANAHHENLKVKK